MQGPLTQFGQLVSRHPGIFPGRRLALVLVLALGSLGASAATAEAADSTVVNATIYPGAGGTVTTPSVMLSTLQTCPLYSGPGTGPMTLYPSGIGYQPAVGSSWALSTVLQCALQLPLGNVTGVQIDNPASGFETALSGADLTDPSQYADPAAPDALPVISNDGGENQNSYTRPWLGGSDANADDHFDTPTPIELVVYENGSPLKVSAAYKLASRTATAMNVSFGATVSAPDGTPVSASGLTWSWSFGDGATSTDPTPTHSYPIGAYTVTLQVNDAGVGGTDTITVSAPAATTGKTKGGGSKDNKGKSPTGPDRGSGTRTGGSTKKHKRVKRRASGDSTGTTGNTTGAGGSGGDTTPTSAPTTDTTTTPQVPATPAPSPPSTPPPSSPRPAAPHAARPARRPTRPIATTSSPRRLVTGLLVSDVTPLPADVSPLVHTVAAPTSAAPAVRRAVAGSSVPAIAAGLAIVLLLGLGAGRELGWRRGRRVLGVGG